MCIEKIIQIIPAPDRLHVRFKDNEGNYYTKSIVSIGLTAIG